MLVLTRRVGEVIVVSGGIRITVVAVQGNKVRLGVVAPEAVRVDREEVHKRITNLIGDLGIDDAEPSGATGAGADFRR